MGHADLERLRERHPAWRLLRANYAAYVLSSLLVLRMLHAVPAAGSPHQPCGAARSVVVVSHSPRLLRVGGLLHSLIGDVVE